MIGLDTNLIVRILTNDEPEQTERAMEVLAADALWLSKTVILETEWVLRSAYSLPRDVILESFRTLLGFPALELEDGPAVLQALRWYEAGLDFADALHLASLGPADRFATFDETLARKAQEISDTPRVDQV